MTGASSILAVAPRRPLRSSRLAALLLLLCGCPLLEFARPDREFEVETGDAPDADPEEIDAKLRSMTTCRDDLLESISVSWARYQGQVDDDGKPIRQRQGVYLRGIERSAFRRCDAITGVAVAADPGELDLALVAVVTAARQYTGHFRTLAEYLDQEAYRRDDWAGLLSLHPLLEGTHDRWRAADEELGRLIFEAHAENDPKYLELLEERGDHLELAVRALMVQARPLADCIASDDPRALDSCAEELAGFENAWVRFSERRDAQAAAAEAVFWMSTFIDDATDYRQLVRAHLDEVRAGRASTRDRTDLADAYAALVRDANTLDFSFP